MNHDILILTTGTRPHLFVKMRESLLNAMDKAESLFRVTIIVDGGRAPHFPIANRIIQHSCSQGITFSINEWVQWLELTNLYYAGSSGRTSSLNSMRPEVCTIIQDDVLIAPWLFRFIEEHHERLFEMGPWLSGYEPTEHKLSGSTILHDVELQRRAMACAVHMSAKFQTWRELTPIPKVFGEARISPGGSDYDAQLERGNPSREPRLGSRVEHWLQGDCPRIVKPEAAVILKGGVRHIGERESVWNHNSRSSP